MYGMNSVADKRTEAEGFLVHSVFYTIQGEGPWAGLPTIFLRLAGCNLTCSFCDTEFTEGAESYSLQNLALCLRNMAFTHNCNRIVITGGEPMLQPLTNLINNLPNMAFQIETAGTVWPSQFEAAIDKHNVLIVCSPKTPKVHPQIRARCLHFKYIIDARMLYTANGIPENVFFPDCLTEEKLVIYMQPCDVPDAKQARANITHAVNLALEHGYRLSIQIHKIAEVP